MKTSRRASVRRATTRHSIFPASNVLPFYLQFHFAMSVVSRLSASVSPLKKVKQPATIPGNRVVTRHLRPDLCPVTFKLHVDDNACMVRGESCDTEWLQDDFSWKDDSMLRRQVFENWLDRILMNDKLRLRWRGRFVCKIIGLINICNLGGNYCSIKT